MESLPYTGVMGTQPGAQFGIFGGQGLNYENFIKKIKPSKTVFQIHKWRKYFGRFTDIVALKQG